MLWTSVFFVCKVGMLILTSKNYCGDEMRNRGTLRLTAWAVVHIRGVLCFSFLLCPIYPPSNISTDQVSCRPCWLVYTTVTPDLLPGWENPRASQRFRSWLEWPHYKSWQLPTSVFQVSKCWMRGRKKGGDKQTIPIICLWGSKSSDFWNTEYQCGGLHHGPPKISRS